ncbi:MAG: LysR family transcriptional regulator [Gammaproteobacteria bacterium]|nr:LysR family transcriptional regulator [Gammaproteobacteria bacterium]MCP5318776.1 LysR family transcriptional regulator [Chromatiaceae bacterium]MCB1816947.1 LysR family transcriptional regulator [Gammaproteobacteria bacterium]MCP5429782.1 LysR family transcriptional regulator [Chromatiaceae bacterium]MCP5435535.1 LysR family transcriptional regulator [Chromatiaceae bacterium]
MEYKRLPDLKALATLREIVERGGVAEAGRALNVGQPAVTKRLRALERCFDIDLMMREAGRLRLTTAGERVYAFARLVMDHQLELLSDLDQLKAGRNRLRLAVTQSIGEHLLPDLLLAFADAFPDYRIDTRVGYSRNIHTRLATGLADLALTEIQPEHPDVLVQKWLDDELVLVCSPRHPLGNHELLAVAEIPRLTYVLREGESSMRITLDRALADIGIKEIPIAMEVGSTDTIVEMLERGRHVSFLPLFAVQGAINAGVLHLIRIEGLRIKRTLWIARTRNNLDNPVAEAFARLIRELVPG